LVSPFVNRKVEVFNSDRIDAHWGRRPGTQALNYPSVASSLRNINLCMSPEVADRFFSASLIHLLKGDSKSLCGTDVDDFANDRFAPRAVLH
jgi:hypothetical protein